MPFSPVIGGEEYDREVNFSIEFRKWSLENEVENLKEIDIGLMPLDDSRRSHGKGGFKLIQYMGMGIVSVASDVTINSELVDNGVNSFLVKLGEDWKPVLEAAIMHPDKVKMGGLARERIIKNYSFLSNEFDYIQFVV